MNNKTDFEPFETSGLLSEVKKPTCNFVNKSITKKNKQTNKKNGNSSTSF